MSDLPTSKEQSDREILMELLEAELREELARQLRFKRRYGSLTFYDFSQEEFIRRDMGNLKRLIPIADKAAPEQAIQAREQNVVKDNIILENVFAFSLFQDSNMWTIGPYGRGKSFGHIKGYDLIHYLIEHPNKEIPARHVYHQEKIDFDIPTEYTRPEIAIDSKARLKAENALKDLKERCDSTDDIEERDRLTEEIEKFESYLHDGQRKTYSKQDENSRKNVQKLVKAALDTIEKEFTGSAPDLIQELKLITTGHSCRYTGQAVWKLHS